MSATVRGADAVAAFLKTLPAKLERNVLGGALADGATVIADRAVENVNIRTPGDSIADDIHVTKPRVKSGRVTVRVVVQGPNAWKAPWVEHGTDPHLIAKDARSADGRLARRTNRQARDRLVETGEYSLVIGGRFVGPVVEHPGSRPHPFLRPALDQESDRAIAAIDSGIRTRLATRGLSAAGEGETE